MRTGAGKPGPHRAGGPVDFLEAVPPERVLAELHSGAGGLSSREAARRLLVARAERAGAAGAARTWPRDLAAQFTHPLALLLLAAAALAFAGGHRRAGMGDLAVIVLNARSRSPRSGRPSARSRRCAAYLPPHATVVRDGASRRSTRATLVPGDVIVVRGGRAHLARTPRLLEGASRWTSRP